jgi:hypothetical protein
MNPAPDFAASVAFNWLEALRKRTIKNITHIDFLGKYRDVRIGIDQCVLILQGLRFTSREVFLIRIHGALYEPFAGPHYVQIGDEPPFWVHSLTAFRREFFGITDKLSFERSVFVGLSDGEVVRLKIARPYLFMPHGVHLQEGALLKIMKTPSTFFHVGPRAMAKHIDEVNSKKLVAAMEKAAVRKRVRKHLVASVEQLFCSYMRDTHIDHSSALAWFKTDMEYALSTCETLYTHMSRVRPELDAADFFASMAPDQASRPSIVAASQAAQHVVPHLRERMSRVDPAINEALRAAREHIAREGAGGVSNAGGAAAAHMTELEHRALAHMSAYNYMMPPPMSMLPGVMPEVSADVDSGGVLMAAYEEDVRDNMEEDEGDEEDES